MDTYILIAVFLLVFIILPIGIGYGIYKITNLIGSTKLAKIVVSVYSLVVVYFLLLSFYPDIFFTKNDAKKLMSEQHIILKDDFEIEKNYSTWAIGDYYHRFTLQISKADKQKIITQIVSSKSFKKSGEHIEDFLFETKGDQRYFGPQKVQFYENEYGYASEIYKPNGDGYAPTFRIISVSKNDDILTFIENEP